MENKELIKVSKEKWDSICNDYKSVWHQWHLDFDKKIPKDFLGKRCVMSGCISTELGSLLTESVHFEIIE